MTSKKTGGKNVKPFFLCLIQLEVYLLAKRLREAENKLQDLTGYRLKIVERSGTILEDQVHKSDHWQGMDCHRKTASCAKPNSILAKISARNVPGEV